MQPGKWVWSLLFMSKYIANTQWTMPSGFIHKTSLHFSQISSRRFCTCILPCNTCVPLLVVFIVIMLACNQIHSPFRRQQIFDCCDSWAVAADMWRGHHLTLWRWEQLSWCQMSSTSGTVLENVQPKQQLDNWPTRGPTVRDEKKTRPSKKRQIISYC